MTKGCACMRYCSFSSGSKGNVSLFSARNTHILIDAGISAKRIEEGLLTVGIAPDSLSGILVTHEHSDHICGLKRFAERHRLPVYMNEATMTAVCEKTGLNERLVRIFRTGEDFYIRELCVHPVSTSHDAAESVGYCLECGGRRFSFFTDLGFVSKEILELAKESLMVVLEANYDVQMMKDGPYPAVLKKRIVGKKGHLSNENCGEAVVELANSGVAQVILAHLSAENNRPELARETVLECLRVKGIRDGKEILVGLALQDMISPIYEME